MGFESANEFVGRMNYDETFRNSVISCKDARDRAAFVSSKGFFFNEEELEVAKKGYIGDNISYEKYGCCTKPDWYR